MRKVIVFCLTNLVLSIVLVKVANAATYYIAPDACDSYHTDCHPELGNDTNAGTLAQPWKTFTRAWNTNTGLKAGDTLILLNGTYYQQIRPSGNAGTAENPITIKASEDGMVTIDGQFKYDTIIFDHPSLPVDAYYVFEGLNVANGAFITVNLYKNHITFKRLHAYQDIITYS